MSKIKVIAHKMKGRTPKKQKEKKTGDAAIAEILEKGKPHRRKRRGR